MNQNTGSAPAHAGNHDDKDLNGFLAQVNDRVRSLTTLGHPVFRTNATGLWETYLSSFPPEERQVHNCNCCKRFIEKYGSLVVIQEDGQRVPLIWELPNAKPASHYHYAADRLTEVLHRAGVTDLFLTEASTLGVPQTGVWSHLAIQSPATAVRAKASAGMAGFRENLKNVKRALDVYSAEVVDTALQLLNSDALYRSEKIAGQAKFLHKLHRLGPRNREQLLRREVALAPEGFCHPFAGVIGTLLEDIKAGMKFEDVAKRFAFKMSPERYLTPTAAPAEGAIRVAAKLFQEKGLESALRRRFCRVDEILKLWEPKLSAHNRSPDLGVFGDLMPRHSSGTPRMEIPEKPITWVKFLETVLPSAEKILIRAPRVAFYGAFLTAADPASKPILQWDTEEARNPVSWYVHTRGAQAEVFGLTPLAFHEVAAISPVPSLWQPGFEHQGTMVLIAIIGCRDRSKPNINLFPEMLKNELHGVRSVIEAYSQRNAAEDTPGELAAGLFLSSRAQQVKVCLRVQTGGITADYSIDRWD